MYQNSQVKIDKIVDLVVRWYGKSGRDLPWRKSKDPYSILVSEVMLQQTQVDRVVPKFMQFLKQFPNLESLAEAPVATVIRLWEGLGFNRRAIRLKKIAEILVRENYAEIPENPNELRLLPGIGRYTSNAIACFAYGKSVSLADTNIYRILSRVSYGIKPTTRAEIDKLIDSSLPFDSPSDFYQGLMDIGALYCKSSSPECSNCVLISKCKAGPEFLEAKNLNPQSSVPYYPKQKRFKGSKRYYRGLIIKQLTKLGPEEQIGISDLKERIAPELMDYTEDWFLSIIKELNDEGLLVVEEGTYSRRVALPLT